LKLNFAHPLISGICTTLSLVGLVVGVMMIVLTACGIERARKAAGICGLLIFIPLVAGILLMYSVHWEFKALAPVAALSADGTTYRDGCELGPDELAKIRAGGYPNYYYRWYAVIIGIVVLGTLDDRIKRKAAEKQAAKYAATGRRL
jgi:amino acid transporter